MTKEIEEQKKRSYQNRFKKYGVDAKSLSWARKGAAHQRFRQIWAEIDFNNKSVLDIGCGFGELGKFLTKRYEGVDYLGVDIVPEFIAEGKKLYPNLKLEVRDVLGEPMDKKFDVVVASGVINSNVKNNMEYRKAAIKTMFNLAKGVFVFNMLGGHPQLKTSKKSNIWYADSLEVLEYCMGLTRRVILRHHYNPKDFTIFMFPVRK
jgi:SAM-dependent methyltransferase